MCMKYILDKKINERCGKLYILGLPSKVNAVEIRVGWKSPLVLCLAVAEIAFGYQLYCLNSDPMTTFAYRWWFIPALFASCGAIHALCRFLNI